MNGSRQVESAVMSRTSSHLETLSNAVLIGAGDR